MSTEALLIVPSANNTLRTLHVRNHGEGFEFMQCLQSCYSTQAAVEQLFVDGNDLRNLQSPPYAEHYDDQPYTTYNNITEIDSRTAQVFYIWIHGNWCVLQTVDLALDYIENYNLQ